MRLFVVSVAAAMAPIAFAAAVAIHRGYVPVGDSAFFAIRARDVFSRQLPLLGEATSVSLTAKLPFNNPGPLLYDFLAIPTSVFGTAAGLVIGVALLNCSAALGIAVVAYRRGGAGLGVASMAVTAAMCWAMGSHVLVDPVQPSSLLLPFLCFAMLIWSVTCGDLKSLPWAAGVASFLLMSYVTYAYLVVVLSAWGVVGLALSLRADRRADGGPSPATRQRARRASALTGLVLAVCWAQSIFEQFARTGNATRVLKGVNDPGLKPIGFSVGARLVAKVVTLPPWWVRPSYARYLAANQPGVPNPGKSAMGLATSPSLLVALCSLALLAAVLGWCAWSAHRRADRQSIRIITTAAVLLAGGLLTAGRMPLGVFGFATQHTFRWLWPLSAFVFFAIGSTLARRWRRAAPPTALVAALVVATIAVASLNLLPSDQGAMESESAVPAVRDLGRQLGALRGRGPILIVPPTTFHEPYSEGVWAQMQRVGIPFVTNDPYELRHLGPARKFTGTNARVKLLLVFGSRPPHSTPGARRIAVHDGLDRRASAELRALSSSLTAYISHRGLRPNNDGARAVRAGQVARLPALPLSRADAETLLRSQHLATWVERDLLALDRAWRSRFSRYVELRSQQERATIALYLAPIRPDERS